MEPQRLQIAKEIMGKKNKAQGITLQNSIKIDTQTHGTERSPEINTCIYGHLIFDKGAEDTRWGKSLFNK